MNQPNVWMSPDIAPPEVQERMARFKRDLEGMGRLGPSARIRFQPDVIHWVEIMFRPGEVSDESQGWVWRWLPEPGREN